MIKETPRTSSTAPDCVDQPDSTTRPVLALIPYAVAGIAFGFLTIKSEIASWYRIQEMFRFDSFHMYGVIGSAVIIGVITTWLIKRFQLRSLSGERITLTPKEPTWTRYALGGTVFGLGWALVGACPGPMLALAGTGASGILLVLFGALTGTYLYGVLRHRLPH